MHRPQSPALRCPYCGCTDLVQARQGGYGALTGESIWVGCELYHDVCMRCGSVARSYVKDPRKLKKLRDRGEYREE